MLSKIISKIFNTWHFRYLKIQIQVLSNLFYPILMLQKVKKEVNSSQREQIRSFIMYIIIYDSSRTLILNEQSPQN
jgi:hypothetical protein